MFGDSEDDDFGNGNGAAASLEGGHLHCLVSAQSTIDKEQSIAHDVIQDHL